MIDEINVKVTLASANVQLNLFNKGFRLKKIVIDVILN